MSSTDAIPVIDMWAPIRSRGSERPLFLIHGAEGNVLLYRQLAENLRQDRPVYGFHAVGVTDPDTRIEDLAGDYIRELRTVQPDGPYCLGGYCLGGVVAYEMAQQLHVRGERVARLFLFDTFLPRPYLLPQSSTTISRQLSMPCRGQRLPSSLST